MAASALGERTAHAALFWGRRRDATALRALNATLDDGTRAEAVAILQSGDLEGLADDELLARMLELGAKARGTEHKIMTAEGKSVATITAASPGDTGSGTFSGYLAAYGRDHSGDTIQPGAMDETAAALNSGAIQWHLTDAHSEKASDVVATVTAAAVDHHGLRIAGAWMPTERAQALRQMVRNGAKLGLSIDYLTDSSRPDGKGGRLLDRITVVGGAITPKPMNSAAVITEGKHTASAPVVTVGQDIADGSARRVPDRDRIRREDQLLAAVDWPPPGLFDRETSLALIRGAAAAKTLAVPADEGEAMLAARYEENNNYSDGLARWMAAHRPRR